MGQKKKTRKTVAARMKKVINPVEPIRDPVNLPDPAEVTGTLSEKKSAPGEPGWKKRLDKTQAEADALYWVRGGTWLAKRLGFFGRIFSARDLVRRGYTVDRLIYQKLVEPFDKTRHGDLLPGSGHGSKPFTQTEETEDPAE